MAIAAFDSFQFYDEVVTLKLQSAYGSAAVPDTPLAVNGASFEPSHMELSSVGTTRTRGRRLDQRIKSGRLMTFGFQTDLMDTAAIRSLIEWALGDDAEPTNQIKFATLGNRKTGGLGGTYQDACVQQMDINFQQGQTAKITVSGQVMSDWNNSTAPSAATPAGGTRILIEDTAFSVQGTELPVTSFNLSVAQGVEAVFGNNAFPVSYEVTPYRAVVGSFDFIATSETFPLIQDLRDDTTGDIVVTHNDIVITLKDASIITAMGAEFTGLGMAPVRVTFQANKPDDANPELEITYGS